METAKRIISKDLNNISFYNILPKEELPKYLQKMVFQTINLKESIYLIKLEDLTNSVKIYRKENAKPCESKIRNDLKKKG